MPLAAPGEAGEGGEAKPGIKGDTKLSYATDKMGAADKNSLTDWYEAANEWAKATSDAAEPTTADKFKALDKDIRIVVARPFIEHLMHNAIMTVAGRDTGATLFGPADMQLSASHGTTRTWQDPSHAPPR